VAVKLVQLRWDAESERRRREREVEIDQVLAAISARHVMRLLDVGRVSDDLLLVMPLADRSLSAAVRAGDLDILARVEALRQVAQGLIELAEIPVLHRDLKPANVLGFAGEWKLADFGISRNLLESTDTYTFRGYGTFPYMAPELWNGRPATVKTDLYALGVLAFEVLTGGRPFTGVDEAILCYLLASWLPRRTLGTRTQTLFARWQRAGWLGRYCGSGPVRSLGTTTLARKIDHMGSAGTSSPHNGRTWCTQ
jgi:serine/threonine protein kinase